MADLTDRNSAFPSFNRRLICWCGAAALLLVPLIAMQFSDEVDWTASDFLFAAILIGGVGVAYELAVRMTANRAYRAAVGIALANMFALIWIALAVGVIGSADNIANRFFLIVPVVGVLASAKAHFRPSGMAGAMVATAIAQVIAALLALVGGFVPDSIASPDLLLALAFVGPWLVAALLFRIAAREPIALR